jgi:hypothetical protein
MIDTIDIFFWQKGGIMRFRNIFIVSIFFFCFLILFFCKPEPALTQEQSPEEIMAKIVFSDELQDEINAGDMEKHKINLTDKIVTFRDSLIDLFRPEEGERNFAELGRLLAQRGAVIEANTKKFTWLYGEESIADLFRNLPEGNLEIEIRHVFIDKIFDQKTDGKEEVDMEARIFFKWRVPHATKEGMLTNQAGGGTFGCLHRMGCAWCEF